MHDRVEPEVLADSTVGHAAAVKGALGRINLLPAYKGMSNTIPQMVSALFARVSHQIGLRYCFAPNFYSLCAFHNQSSEPD